MDKKQIKQEFETLKLHDVTINNIWEIYLHGDIEGYIETLTYIIVLLAKEKEDLRQRLLDKIQRTPLKIDFKNKIENEMFSLMGVSKKYL